MKPRPCDETTFMERVALCYDVDSISDILNLDVYDMIEAFHDKIMEQKDDFTACAEPEIDDE